MNRLYAHRREILSGLLLLLLVDVGVYFLWVRRPAAAEPETNPGELARLEEEVNQRAAEVDRLKRVRGEAPRLQPQLERFIQGHLLSERAGYSRMAADLEQAARQAGVELGRISYEAPEEREENLSGLKRVEISTSVEGGYSDLLGYLRVLEASPRLYLINELNLASARRGRVRLEMRVVTYMRRAA